MSDLQKFIWEHRDEFDDTEPGEGHFERFAARLDDAAAEQPVRHRPVRMLKIAAVIIVLISASVAVFDLATREIRERFASRQQESELPLEVREAVQYYDGKATAQLALLDKIMENNTVAGTPGLSALTEIRSLDATTAELKKALACNPGNEQILDAIIQNQRMKETMLNNIINQLSQARK